MTYIYLDREVIYPATVVASTNLSPMTQISKECAFICFPII